MCLKALFLVNGGFIPSLISLFVNPFDGTSTGIVHILESLIPFQCDGCGACHTRLTGDTTGSTVGGEMLRKDTAVIILLLVLWRIDRKPLCGMRHLLVTHCLTGHLLEGVNPRIPYPVTELFFLSPDNLLR